MWLGWLGGGLAQSIDRAFMVLVGLACTGTGCWCLAALAIAAATRKWPRPGVRILAGAHGVLMLVASVLLGIGVAGVLDRASVGRLVVIIGLVGAPLVVGGVVDLVTAVRAREGD